MKITIGENKPREINTTPRYKLDIKFMHGDADGYETKTMLFNDFDPDTFLDLKRVILAVAACCELYPNGRGGDDDYDGYSYYDAFFKQNPINHDWYDFLFSESEWNAMSDAELIRKVRNYLAKLNPEGHFIEHPYSYEGDTQSSIDSYEVTYIDKNNTTYPVEIEFDEEEKKIIEEAKTFFR